MSPVLRPRTKTARGFLGRSGGRWGRVPQPPAWYSTSVQACGIYPFASGAARPTSGAPLGRDMITKTWVAADPDSLYRTGVISSASMMLMGINGVGKSSTAQTMMLGMVGRGMTPAWWDPIKGEHTALARALGSTIVQVSPSGDRLNLLDAGPLGNAAERIGGKTGGELRRLARDKAVDLVKIVATISRGNPLEDVELAVLEALTDEAFGRPGARSADLYKNFQSPSEQLLADVGYGSVERFHDRFRRLKDTLWAMLTGELGQLISGDRNVRFDAGNPAGFCFDTSAISQSKTKLLSAAMLSTWSIGMDAIDAHWELAQHEAAIALEAAQAGEEYVPQVFWRGYVTCMDEFWWPLRSVPGMVDKVDTLSRTNRSKGTADIRITHGPKDFESLPNANDRQAARGLVERSGLIALMALTREDLRTLRDRSNVALTDQEIELVGGFNAAKSWKGAARAGAGSRVSPPPGAGKVLLKVPERVGIPIDMVQTSVQKRHHNTDERFRE